MTEQQIPMLMRLIMLLMALHQRQLKSSTDLTDITGESEAEDNATSPDDSWTGWAWRAASSLLPADEPDDDWNSVHSDSYRGHTLNTGLYIDHATFTFKVLCCYIYSIV